MKNQSELSWKLSDYHARGLEAPARLVTNPELTEGELMNADEVAEFIKDSLATLRILNDKQSDRYSAIKDSYLGDLKYLMAVGAISDDDYNELTSQDNLTF